MNFTPVIPFGGLSGWGFLTRTIDAQKSAFASGTAVQRDIAYFKDAIGDVRSAEDLVQDRRLLSVALGAFGLGDDINNTYLIQKVLEDGTLDPDALANRFSDQRYKDLAGAFGFGDFDIPRTALSDFGTEITDLFLDREFERAVGSVSEDMRLALEMNRHFDGVLASDSTSDGYWFAVLGTPPLRAVFEAALGLPSSIAALDLDQQVELFRQKAHQRFGSGELTAFSDAEHREELQRLFLSRAQLETSLLPGTPGLTALTLLQGAGSTLAV